MDNDTRQGENIERMLRQEQIEQKRTARGVHNRASRTGKVSVMRMPFMFAGRGYKKNGKVDKFNVDELLELLHGTSCLKDLLLSKVEEEYKNYNMTLGKTLDGVGEIMEKVIEKVVLAVDSLNEQIEFQNSRIEEIELSLKILREKRSKEIQDKLDALKKELEEVEEVVTGPSTRVVQQPRVSRETVKEEGVAHIDSKALAKMYGPLPLKFNPNTVKPEDIFGKFFKEVDSQGLPLTMGSARIHVSIINSKAYGPTKQRYWRNFAEFLASYFCWKENYLGIVPTDSEVATS